MNQRTARRSLERQFQTQLYHQLRDQGRQAVMEYPVPSGGLVDIALFGGGDLVELIECKVKNLAAGVGQLLQYEHALGRIVRLTLAVPKELYRDPGLHYACKVAGVLLWTPGQGGQSSDLHRKLTTPSGRGRFDRRRSRPAPHNPWSPTGLS
jgi:hypothetical protein